MLVVYLLIGLHGKPTAPFLSALVKKLVDVSGDPRVHQWLHHQCLSLECGQGKSSQHIGLCASSI